MNNWRAYGHLKAISLLAPSLTVFAAFCSVVACERDAPRAQSMATKELPSTPAPDSGPPPSNHSVEALAGEEDLENRFQHTVTVTPFPSPPRGISKQCSGVLVSPRAVLTAGHCFCSKRKAGLTGMEGSLIIDGTECITTAIVTTFVYSKSEQGSGPSYQAREYRGTVRLHPAFKISTDEQENVLSSTGDLAIVSLNPPAGEALPAIPLASMGVKLNETVTLVGYGYDEAFGTLGGRRRHFKARVTGSPDTAGGRALLEKPSQTRYKGDSGGPCLRETAQGMELVGILSRALGQEPSFTSTHLYEHWLKEEIQRASAPEQAPGR